MALISSRDYQRIPIPHEPKEWMELRPLTTRDSIAVAADSRSPGESLVDLYARVIRAWSYDEPPSVEALMSLDSVTFAWIGEALTTLSGGRSDEEKKDSTNGWSQPTATTAPSLVNSAI